MININRGFAVMAYITVYYLYCYYNTMFDGVLLYIGFCTLVLWLLFFWYPCMAINVSVQYNGGLLPDIILLTQCY